LVWLVFGWLEAVAACFWSVRFSRSVPVAPLGGAFGVEGGCFVTWNKYLEKHEKQNGLLPIP